MKKRKIVKRKRVNGLKKVTVLLETQMTVRHTQEVYIHKGETIEQNVKGASPWCPNAYVQGEPKSKIVKVILTERTES